MSDRNVLNRRHFLWTSVAAGTAAAVGVARGADPTEHPLPWRVGTGKAEITPPLEVGILTSSGRRDGWAPFKGVRVPLCARATVIESGKVRIGLVALDLLGLASEAVGGMEAFKRRVAAAAGHAVAAESLVLTSTHTHSAPASLALTDLYQTEPFKKWVGVLARQIGSALQGAAGSMRPCRLAVGRELAPGLGVYRRVMTDRGIRQPHVIRPENVVIGPEGPNDEEVRIAAFLDRADQPAAILVNATAHPIYEMSGMKPDSLRMASPDYPGEMARLLDERHSGSMALFFQGTAGNINTPEVSVGAAGAERHGRQLADLVDRSLGTLRAVEGSNLAIGWRQVKLPARNVKGEPQAEPLLATVGALRLGNMAMVFLPGEPFVEIGLGIRFASPFGFTFTVGYSESYIGYIPTDRAFWNGGYEPGPGRWSRVATGSELALRQGAIELLKSLKGRE